MSQKSALRFIRITATTVLLLYVLGKAGLFRPQGWQALGESFIHANPWLILAAIGVRVLSSLTSSIKWHMLAVARGLEVSLWRLWAYYMVGKFFNLVLPSSIGGDVVRVHALGRYTGRYADALAVVFVERFSGLVTLVMLALIAVVVNLQIFNLPWLTTALSIVALSVGIVCWLIIDERPYKFIQQKSIVSQFSPLEKLLSKVGKFRHAVLAYQHNPSALWWALGNSLIFYATVVLNVWVSTLALHTSINFVSVLIAVPIIVFIMNIPFSIGGIGLMEFAYTFTLGLFGINPTIAISTALLMRVKALLEAGVGGLLYPLVSEDNLSPYQLSQSIKTPVGGPPNE